MFTRLLRTLMSVAFGFQASEHAARQAQDDRELMQAALEESELEEQPQRVKSVQRRGSLEVCVGVLGSSG
jgi:hypothetical protein